jgi:uncharacterized protein YkwD
MRSLFFLIFLAGCGSSKAGALALSSHSQAAVETQPSEAQAAIQVANEIRKQNGLPELVFDPKLTAVAQAHAEDMLNRKYFDHNTPEGLTPFDRIQAGGVDFQAAAENIAMGENDPHAVFDLWLNSPGHRRNLLNKDYGHQGIGYAGGYWVHDFAN